MSKGMGRMVSLCCAAVLIISLMICGSGWNAAFAEETSGYANAAEAEAARAEAEAFARGLAQEVAKLTATAEKADAGLEEATEALDEATEALEAAQKAFESADDAAKEAAEQRVVDAKADMEAAEKEVEKWEGRVERSWNAVEEKNQELIDAAMVLKEATEASVQLANAERMNNISVSDSFELGERFNGTFNEDMDPLYVSFLMSQDAKVRITTKGVKVSISVLDDTGSTIRTLVPTSGGKGSVCSLAEGEYTLMIAAMGEDKGVSIGISVYQEEEKASSEESDKSGLVEFDEDDDETEMETLVEFD